VRFRFVQERKGSNTSHHRKTDEKHHGREWAVSESRWFLFVDPVEELSRWECRLVGGSPVRHAVDGIRWNRGSHRLVIARRIRRAGFDLAVQGISRANFIERPACQEGLGDFASG